MKLPDPLDQLLAIDGSALISAAPDRKELPDVAHHELDDIARNQLSALFRDTEVGQALSLWLYVLWLSRVDLQSQFPLRTSADARGLFVWALLEHRDSATPQFGWLRTAANILTSRLAEVPDRDDGEPVTDLAMALWERRDDLRSAFDLATPEGRRGLAGWFVVYGIRELPVAVAPAGEYLRLLQQEIGAVPHGNAALPFQRLVHLVWHAREDLQKSFDPTTVEGRAKLVDWFLYHGIHEHGLYQFLDQGYRAWLASPDPALAANTTGNGLPISRLQLGLWRSRPDLRAQFNWESADDRQRYFCWYYTRGLDEPEGSSRLTANELRWLNEPVGGAASEPDRCIPRGLLLLWWFDAGVQARFPSRDDKARRSLKEWFVETGHMEFPGLAACLRTPSATVRRARRRAPRPGVNVVGDALGTFGIAEDVRCAARALAAAGVPVGVVHQQFGPKATIQDDRAQRLLMDSPQFTINLICGTPGDTARLLVSRTEIREHRHSIAYWPWELPVLPRSLHFLTTVFDELWASTRFVKAAFEECTGAGVALMPMAVTIERKQMFERRDYDLPEKQFLFLFVFDSHSTTVRKNPLACVDAFQTAFPRDDCSVGLVVKVMNGRDEDSLFRHLLLLAEADRRIRIYSETMERDQLLGLMECCDAFVSLHRSEGFGRAIAEAMLLERPVIATAFSGSSDFVLPDTACPVAYRMVPVPAAGFPHGANQIWADPDIEHAAWFMRRLRGDTTYRERIARSGRAFIATRHSPEAVGRRYRAHLEQAGLLPKDGK